MKKISAEIINLIFWIPLWKCNFKCVYCQGWRNTNGLEFQPFNIIKEVFDRFFDKICEYKAKDDFIDFEITGGERLSILII
jgi:sulfatase maturation enzyme AslB (radical SAM superfamily)